MARDIVFEAGEAAAKRNKGHGQRRDDETAANSASCHGAAVLVVTKCLLLKQCLFVTRRCWISALRQVFFKFFVLVFRRGLCEVVSGVFVTT